MSKKRQEVDRRKFMSNSAKALGVTAAFALPSESFGKSSANPEPLSQADRLEIVAYALRWNARTNQGHLFLAFKNRRWVRWQMRSLDELSGYASILQKRPVFLFTDGTVGTNWEATGLVEDPALTR
jgi:hypothetical protein